MKKSLKYVLILGILIPMVLSSLNAQQPVLKKQEIGNGGYLNAVNSEGVKMSGMVGQLAISTKSGTDVLRDGKIFDAHQGFWVPVPKAGVGVEENNISYNKNLLNYPNPLNNSTTIKYELTNPANVTLKVYDMVGNVVKVLFDGFQNVGVQEIPWDAKNSMGMEIGSGSYVYEISVRPSGMAGSNGFAAYNMRSVMVVVK